MISVQLAELASVAVDAVLRPISAEWDAVTPAMRRLERAAGPEVEAQCRAMGELPVGSAVITRAGALPAEFMVHVVIRSRDEPVTAAGVRRGLHNGLRRASELGVASLALPLLGTGAGNLEVEEAADLLLQVLAEHHASAREPSRIDIVVDSPYEREVLERRLPATDSSPAS